MDNIIKFPKEFKGKASYEPFPVNKTLLSADRENLDEVIVLGCKNGEIKIFSSESNTTKIVFLCDYAKALIMKSVIGDLVIDVK